MWIISYGSLETSEDRMHYFTFITIYYQTSYSVMENSTSLFREIKNDLETVKRHISIVQTLMNEQPVGIIKISHETGIPEHKIRYSLRVLEKEGLILPSREGAILTPEFLESKDKLIQEAEELADEMQEIYHNLKASLLKK